MRRLIISALAAGLMTFSALAQTTAAEHRQKYDNQVKKVGYDGPGVEIILDRWEADFPEDLDMLYGRFNLYLAKSISTRVVEKEGARYLGAKPILTLKDSLGRDVYYYQENDFDDEYFALSEQAIDKAIRLAPDRLDLRFNKATALFSYEKESPDMATSLLSSLIDYNYAVQPEWKSASASLDDDDFEQGIQDFCASFYALATPASYESFRMLSEKMLKYLPKSTVFMNNLGSYNFVVKQDYKAARKYYDKVIKMEPGNYNAIKNSVLMARRQKSVKLEKKYLPLLVKISPDENERMAAKARLDALNSK
ncbi:MAG: hypothetical protein MR330_02900 [Rikenellaceae bacterium]|nr:hypothetical protein [Rikenellaceae bacterium]